MHLLPNVSAFLRVSKLSAQNRWMYNCHSWLNNMKMCTQVIVKMLHLTFYYARDIASEKQIPYKECKQCRLYVHSWRKHYYSHFQQCSGTIVSFFFLVFTLLQISMCSICFSSCQFFLLRRFSSLPSLGFSI